uniref:Zinc finger protein n=1 Tax=Setaria digitata TaxID=48799 RepID=A0A915PHZ1_9BILA
MTTLSTCAQDGNGSLNPMSFTDQHGNVVLERLRYQRDTGRFCDVYIVVKDRHFCAHRNILAACSPYFDSILRNSKVVKEQVTVNCQNPAVFELLLNYMYSGSVVIDRSSVTDLLKLANNFLITRVKNYCAEYLDRYMDSANCLSVKELALKYNLPALLKSACDFFDVNINRLIVHWIGHNPAQRDSLFKDMLAACSFASVQSATLEYLLDYSSFLINSQAARYTLMQKMFEHSMPMAKYQAQYRTLTAQFGSERTIFYNDAHLTFGSSSQPQSQPHGISQGESGFVNVKSESGNSQSGRIGDEVREVDSNKVRGQPDYNEETGQPPVIGASTTQEVVGFQLNPTEANDGSRPALKLKIHLNSMNILNRKNRLLAAAGRHKLYRKSITAANQVLAKRRGRPPKNKGFVRSEALKSFESPAGEELFPDSGVDINEQVIFDEADEVDPCSQQNESDSERNGEASGTAVEKLFKCDYCAYKSSTAVLLKHHIVRAHTRNIAYVCSLCVYECRWNRDYYEHMKTHFPGPPFQCDICQYGNECIQSLLSHRLTHSDERPFKCTLCEYKSRSRNHLIGHIRNHTVDKPFHCSECGRAFAMKSTLDQHVAAHSENRPYQCLHCDFSTKYQSHLISHRRIHSGDVFHCHYEECTYSSPKKSQLAAHLRTHLAVRAHHCKTCNRSFIEKSHLVRHERIHLEDKPFKCDNCDYSSSRRDKLKEHIQKHHSNSNTGKQHRRRYRRAKQLAQLAAQAKQTQPNIENMFRPIPPSELVDSSSNNLNRPVTTNVLPQQNISEFTLTNISRTQNEHRQPQTAGHVEATQQTHQHSLMDFSSLNTTNSLNIGRPSSATVPATTAMSVSPAMSLNFHIGAIMDSPIESLRTPVPRSPHSVSIHSDFFDNSSPAVGQDAQRPMSLPPYSGGGSSATNNQITGVCLQPSSWIPSLILDLAFIFPSLNMFVDASMA